MSVKQFVTGAVLCAAAGVATNAHAQWLPNYQVFSIQRIGLFGTAHTSTAGLQDSFAEFRSIAGYVVGYSNRYALPNFSYGQNTWVYNPVTNTTLQTGLTGTDYGGDFGYQFSQNNLQNNAGQIAGTSERITGFNPTNGRNTWFYNPTTNTSVQTGLTSNKHTGSAGYQVSANQFINDAGQVAGSSNRYIGVNTNNGQNTWVYNPATGATVQIGLISDAYSGSAGYQYSVNDLQNAVGQVAGTSNRYIGVNTNNGQNTWIYNPATSTTVRTGFTGAAYTGSTGYQYSVNNLQNDAGQIAGYSLRITGVNTDNGRNTWVYNPTTSTTVQTGFTGAAYTGSAGYQYSQGNLQNAVGQVAGHSQRITAVNTDNGRNTWVYSPVTSTNLQIGLTGAAYTGSSGYQYSVNDLQNDAGQVAGYSQRITGVNTDHGRNTWIYNTVTSTTVQTGLTGSSYTGSAGYQFSVNNLQNAAGQVAGYSQRINGVNTDNGQNTWSYNPLMNTTVQTGLTGATHTGSAGYQASANSFQNAAGQIAGISLRVNGVNSTNGQNTWVYNPTTNMTVQTGLTGAAYNNNAGYQFSDNTVQSASGLVAGYTRRVNTSYGRDAWYFDPLTGVTSAIITPVFSSDFDHYSVPIMFTEGGYLLGYYRILGLSGGPSTERAFIFRPDLGLTDLGNLVNGGLNANGWSILQRPQFTDALRTIVGYGYAYGQNSGRSVFVMVPAPGAAVLLGLGGLVVARRHR